MALSMEKWKSDMSKVMIARPVDEPGWLMSGSFYKSSPTLEQQAWEEYNDINLILVIDEGRELPVCCRIVVLQK